jgi:hypothetical protein
MPMSAYEHGSQDISAHQGTYTAILRVMMWSGALIGLATLYLSMVFAGGMSWFTSLIIVYVLSILVGMALKRGGVWYAVMTGIAIVTVLIGWATTLIASML